MEGTGHVFGSFTNEVPPKETCILFLDNGECSDEIVLIFDDGKKLYVSENFLCYASPVFKAMFKHDFKEKETREVTMKKKSFDDFQEFLHCLHPGQQKEIDYNNVLRVASLAQEYQVESCVRYCRQVMIGCLTKEYESATGSNDKFKIGRHVEKCLNVLTTAVACEYEEVVTHAIEIIARFGHTIFTGSEKQSKWQPQNVFQKPSVFTFAAISKSVDPREECKRLFEGLPEGIKAKLAFERLKLCDNDQMR